MRLVRLPGVYRPRSDTQLLLRALHEQGLAGRAVLDLCTGTGALAVSAALAGADVVAADLGRRAVLNARLNARLNGAPVTVLRGDLFAPVAGHRFDVVVSNPPYLPGAERPSGAARAWDAGADGRELLDRICAGAADHLRPGGRLLLMQSSLAGIDETERALENGGLRARLVIQQEGPLGPLAAERRHLHGEDRETLAVLEGVLVTNSSAGSASRAGDRS